MNFRWITILVLLTCLCLLVLETDAKKKCKKKSSTTSIPFITTTGQTITKGGRGAGGIEEAPGKPHRTRKPRVIGGEDAIPYYYKSIVAVHVKNSTKCGGTILAPEWILTAAHCIISQDAKDFVITAGEYVRSKKEGPEQNVNVKKIFVHQDYNKDTDAHDIALFYLESPIVFNDKIQAVNMPTKDFVPQEYVHVVGWGKLKEKSISGADTLQFVPLPIISNEDCQAKYETYEITSEHICTLSPGGGKDACQGDSGGPLYSIDKQTGVQTIVGIVSWGVQCADEDSPGVYSRVTAFLDWIDDQIKSVPPPPPPSIWKPGPAFQIPPVFPPSPPGRFNPSNFNSPPDNIPPVFPPPPNNPYTYTPFGK